MKKMKLTKDRPTTSITMRIPVDVLEDLKRIAPMKGMSGYQALIKFYIGQGLRKDLADVMRQDFAERTKDVLQKYKVPSKAIEEIMNAV
ncbi:MAG: hypothetical protein GY849_10045 [Deltaproteobacteria bacterium]|nr:hypothetical protein [Deltaproteobacteria bacterium]